MSRRRESERLSLTPAEAPTVLDASVEPRPAPPKKRPWQLAISCALMLAWILFLATMAWR